MMIGLQQLTKNLKVMLKMIKNKMYQVDKQKRNGQRPLSTLAYQLMKTRSALKR